MNQLLLSRLLPATVLLLAARPVQADPQLNSWHTEGSSQYARIYESAAAETARTPVTTWSRGTGVQSSPTYAGISKIVYSGSWVYLRASGLASHLMGPWYLNAAKTQNFPNFPSNTAKTYRIPRNPVIPATKTLTGLGATGVMVNGVSMFDSRDAFSYASGSSADATGPAGWMMVFRCVSSKSKVCEVMPLTSAALAMSTFSARPSTVACADGSSSCTAVRAASAASWWAAPMAQPSQL